MKKLLFITLILTAFVSCKNDKKTDNQETVTSESQEKTAKQSDGLTLLKGDYVYHGGAAVLQTHAEIYGVLPIGGVFNELNDKAEALKTEPTDMVKVEIRGKITNEKHETILWENKVEVLEILSVKPISKEQNNIIKLGS